jgi:hypothetical protein
LIVKTNNGVVTIQEEQRLWPWGVVFHQGLKTSPTVLVIGAVGNQRKGGDVATRWRVMAWVEAR